VSKMIPHTKGVTLQGSDTRVSGVDSDGFLGRAQVARWVAMVFKTAGFRDMMWIQRAYANLPQIGVASKINRLYSICSNLKWGGRVPRTSDVIAYSVKITKGETSSRRASPLQASR